MLRALEPDDVGLLYEWENDTAEWDSGETFTPVSRHDMKTFINHADLDIYHTRQMRLMIVRKSDNQTVGYIDMFDFDPFNMHASVGILINHKFRLQGFAKDTLRVFCKYAFNFLSVNALLATTATTNTASKALFSGCGFRHVGVFRGWIRRNNVFGDVELFQISKADFQ